VRVEVRPDRIAVVTLDDASVTAGVLTEAFGSELERVVERLRTDAGIVGVVLMGANAQSFVLRGDLVALQTFTLARDAEGAARGFARRLTSLRTLGKPVVAALHGPALGAGLELALACDTIVATDDASTVVSLPEIHLGLLPAGSGLLRVAERAGLGTAIDLGLGGESLDVVTAKRLGLVDEVCPWAILLDVAASHARRTTRPSLLRVARRAFENNPVTRRRVVARARAALRATPRGRSLAAAKIIDVVERYGRSGFRAAAELEARAFGELVVTEASRRLVEVSVQTSALGALLGEGRMPRSLIERGIPAYTERIHAGYVREARALVAEGVPVRAINAAMIEWGWAVGPLADDGDPLPGKGKARGRAIEDIQMRCVLPLVNEALTCLGEHVVRDPCDGDLGAILALGFPAFRGGPFRYVDAVGPAEILRRVRAYETQLGPRWAPAPLLIERASTGQRFYHPPVRD
jgi:enoyl-CoA hydratase/carnithine racemase